MLDIGYAQNAEIVEFALSAFYVLNQVRILPVEVVLFTKKI